MELILLPEDTIGVGQRAPGRSHTHVPADTSSSTDTGQGLDGNWYALIGYSEATSDVDDFFAVGLTNLGNICYINALLHALARLSTVSCWTMQHRTLCRRSDCPLCDLAGDLSVLTSPKTMSSHIPLSAQNRAAWGGDRFNNYQQQDSSEAFTALLTACDEVDVNAALLLGISGDLLAHGMNSSRYSTPQYRAFGGLTASTLRCKNKWCLDVSDKDDITHCLTLEMPSVQSTIKQLLEHHWSFQDLIDEGDRCHKCQAPMSQSKGLRLKRWPHILVLHLKRLTVLSQSSSIQIKISTQITFEDSMTVAGKSLPYKLRAIIVHHGNADAGHYTAMVRDQDRAWYNCDDFEPPTRMSDAKVMATEPYMLFYEA